jgi:hypothetical protein
VLQGLTKLGVLGMFYVGGTFFILNGIEKGNVGRCLSPPLWAVLVLWGCPWPVGRGWSLAQWVHEVILRGGRSLLLLSWRCIAPQGPCHMWAVWVHFFSLILVQFEVSCVGLLSKTKTKTKTSFRSQK